MIILRCLRPDRIIFACMEFVEQKMRKEFIETRPVRLDEVYKATDNSEPIIFVLSPGIDPSDQLSNLALSHDASIKSLALEKAKVRMSENDYKTELKMETGSTLRIVTCQYRFYQLSSPKSMQLRSLEIFLKALESLCLRTRTRSSQ